MLFSQSRVRFFGLNKEATASALRSASVGCLAGAASVVVVAGAASVVVVAGAVS